METAELGGAAAGRKHEHGLSRRAGLAHHVDAVGRHDEEIAVREKVAVGVGALPVPEDARERARCLLHDPAQPIVRAPRGRDEEAHAEPAQRAQRAREPLVVLVAELVDRVLAAKDDGDARARECGDGGRHRAPQLGQALCREAVRRGERREYVGSPQSIVLRHPDHVGRAEPGLGILHHDRESCRARPSPQRPHVRDAAASERDGDIGPRRGKLRARLPEALRRRHRRPGRAEPPDPPRLDPLHLVVEAQRFRHAPRLYIHAGHAAGDEPPPHAGKRAAADLVCLDIPHHEVFLSAVGAQVESLWVAGRRRPLQPRAASRRDVRCPSASTRSTGAS